jgi:hypothetical protein
MKKPASMSVAKYRQTLAEHDLQASVLDYLKLHRARGVFAFSIPNAAKRSPWQAARMKREGLLAGVADVCVMMNNGRTGWLEFKTIKGGQSVAQQVFEARCTHLSHHYALCRNLPDAIEALRNWRALR